MTHSIAIGKDAIALSRHTDPAPVAYDAFHQIVGVPIDLWHSASTVEAVQDLIQRREAGDFPLVPLPVEPCARCRCSIQAVTAFDGTVRAYYCLCPDPSITHDVVC